MFRGSIVALATPMDGRGTIDFDSLTRLVDFHLQNKTDGIVVAGTTGESGTLMAAEKERLIAHVVEQVAGKIPVIAGTGAVATTKTIELTRRAMELGVDGCLLMTPPYVKPTQEGLFRHFEQVAHAVPIPQILYNVPGRTGCDLLPETIERLAKLPNIVGIKEATGQLERLHEILQRCGSGLDLLSGDDITAKDFILQGGKGVISVTANVAPKAMAEMCQAAIAHDGARAQVLNEPLIDLHHALFLEANPIPCKFALQEMGLIPEGIRLPLTPLSQRYHTTLRAALQKAGIL